MRNIMRSLYYYISRDIPCLIAGLILLLLPPLVVFWSADGSLRAFRSITGGMYFAHLAGDLFIVGMIGMLLLIGRIAGSDAGDKTMNYELLYGRSRASVFMARVCVSLTAAFFVWLCLSLPSLYFAAINGWGLETEPMDVLARYLLAVFPLLRNAAFFVLLGFIGGSAGKGILLGFVLIEAESMFTSVVELLTDFEFGCIFGMTDMTDLLSYDNAKNIVVDGKQINRYISELSFGRGLASIVVSLLAAAAYLLLGYLYFKRKDRH